MNKNKSNHKNHYNRSQPITDGFQELLNIEIDKLKIKESIMELGYCCNCGKMANEEKRNTVKEFMDSEVKIITTFDAHCSDCGEYLYHFEYGHKEF